MLVDRGGRCLQDASQRGIRLALSRPISRHVQVKITIAEAMIVTGDVVYCRPAGEIYYAGIALRDATDEYDSLVSLPSA